MKKLSEGDFVLCIECPYCFKAFAHTHTHNMENRVYINIGNVYKVSFINGNLIGVISQENGEEVEIRIAGLRYFVPLRLIDTVKYVKGAVKPEDLLHKYKELKNDVNSQR